MNPSFVRVSALMLALGAVPVGAVVLSRPLWSLRAVASGQVPSRRAPAIAIAAIDSVARAAGRSAPFRPSRTPARISFDARRAVAPPTPQVPRPSLILTGIVWGRDPAAVIEGLPGVEGGRVVRRGDLIGGITIKQITRTGVSATGLDTAWVLKVRELWR